MVTTISNEQLAQIIADCDAKIEGLKKQKVDAIAQYVAEKGITNGCRVLSHEGSRAGREYEICLYNPARDMRAFGTRTGVNVCVPAYPITKKGEVAKIGEVHLSVDHITLINKEK